MLTTGQQLTIEEAKKYNREQREWRGDAISKGISIGCTDRWACESCGIIVIDSICLCAGSFDCPKCGAEHGHIPDLNLTPVGDFTMPLDPDEQYFASLRKEKDSLQDRVEALVFYGCGDECYELFCGTCNLLYQMCSSGDLDKAEILYEWAKEQAEQSKEDTLNIYGSLDEVDTENGVYGYQ